MPGDLRDQPRAWSDLQIALFAPAQLDEKDRQIEKNQRREEQQNKRNKNEVQQISDSPSQWCFSERSQFQAADCSLPVCTNSFAARRTLLRRALLKLRLVLQHCFCNAWLSAFSSRICCILRPTQLMYIVAGRCSCCSIHRIRSDPGVKSMQNENICFEPLPATATISCESDQHRHQNQRETSGKLDNSDVVDRRQ